MLAQITIVSGQPKNMEGCAGMFIKNNYVSQSNRKDEQKDPAKYLATGIFPRETFPVYTTSNYLSPLQKILESHRYQALIIVYDKVLQEKFEITDITRLVSVPVIEISLEGGEKVKTLSSFNEVIKVLEQKNLPDNTLMVVVGGGTIINFAGFVASIWKGMEPVFIPTTFTAMCDVAIGSLQMINLGHSKNKLRNYYDPLAIILSKNFIDSLPHKEKKNGLVEAFKHGLTQDKKLFEKLERLVEEEQIFGTDTLFEIAVETAVLKNELIEEDPFSEHTKAILSYGHTIAYALEEITDYKISHGEAVSIGTVIELNLFHERNSVLFKRTSDLLLKLGLPTVIPSSISTAEIVERFNIHGKKGFPQVTDIGALAKNKSGLLFTVDRKKLETILQQNRE